MNPTEEELTRQLHHHADGLENTPLTLNDIKGRAGRIQRRRRIATGAAALAAAAIIVPTAMFGADALGSSGNEGRVATNSAEPSPSSEDPSPDSEAWPRSLDTSDLATGTAPTVTWSENDTIHTPDGDVPYQGQVGRVAAVGDDWLVLDSATLRLVRLDDQGTVLEHRATSPLGLATSTDGRHVLYVAEGALHLVDNETGEDQVIREDDGTRVSAVGVATVTDLEVTGEDRVVAYYNLGGTEGPEEFASWSDGEETTRAELAETGEQHFLSYTAVSNTGWVSGLTETRIDGSCSDITDAHGQQLAPTCDLYYRGFSPDGDHVLATPAYGDGFGDGELAIVATDGEVLVHFQRQGDSDPYFMESVWEDDDHVLVRAFTPEVGSQTGTWQILRIGLDGSVENAVDPVQADELTTPFLLG